MKFHGLIGFWFGTCEVRPGVYRSKIEEKEYFGEILQNFRDWQGAEKQNEDLTISYRITIISDLYLQQNISSVRYIVWMNTKWKVTKIEMGYPTITLHIGGVYNGEEQIAIA